MIAIESPAPLQARVNPAVVLAVSAAAGVGLGVVDLVAQRTVPYPLAELANTNALWALAAFAIGCWVGTDSWRAALGGSVLLVVAVGSYYVAAVVLIHDSVFSYTSSATLTWILFGIVAGSLFGAAGAWSRSADWLTAPVGTAIGASVLFAEALVLAHTSTTARFDRMQVALLEVALGIGVVLLAGRTSRNSALALALCAPFTALGYFAFTAAGFAG